MEQITIEDCLFNKNKKNIAEIIQKDKYKRNDVTYVRFNTMDNSIIYELKDPKVAIENVSGYFRSKKLTDTIVFSFANINEYIRPDIKCRFFINFTRTVYEKDDNIFTHFMKIVNGAIFTAKKYIRNDKTSNFPSGIDTALLEKYIICDNSRNTFNKKNIGTKKMEKIIINDTYTHTYRAYFPFIVFKNISEMKRFAILVKDQLVSENIQNVFSEFNVEEYTQKNNIIIPYSININNVENDTQFMADYEKKENEHHKIYADDCRTNKGFPYQTISFRDQKKIIESSNTKKQTYFESAYSYSMNHPSRIRFHSTNIDEIKQIKLKVGKFGKVDNKILSYFFVHLIDDSIQVYQFGTLILPKLLDVFGNKINESNKPPQKKIEVVQQKIEVVRQKIPVLGIYGKEGVIKKTTENLKINTFSEFLMKEHYRIIDTTKIIPKKDFVRQYNMYKIIKEGTPYEGVLHTMKTIGYSISRTLLKSITTQLKLHGIVEKKALCSTTGKRIKSLIFPTTCFQSSFEINFSTCKTLNIGTIISDEQLYKEYIAKYDLLYPPSN